MDYALFLGIAAVLLIFLLVSYVKSPPSQAYLISGISRQPRVITGKGGFRVPFIERLDQIYLGQITVDIATGNPVPTNDFINVDVDAVAKIRVMPNPEGIRLAGMNFLNMAPTEIAKQLEDSLQGNLREIIGTLDLKRLNTDRDGFSDQVMQKASPDMNKLGIEIISCNIQNVTDKEGLIKDLGADNTAKIKKDASITKAYADRDVAVETSKASKDANDARVAAETAIEIKNTELAIKKAELKAESDTKQANADVAYAIQTQERQKELNIKTVDANIEKAKREQELSKAVIEVEQNKLSGDVVAKAQADLELKKREAEAIRYTMEQEAAGIKAKGEAEAAAIKAKGIAEAEAMEKKADAYKKYTGAAVMEMMVKILPEVSHNLSDSLRSIDSVNIYGTSGEEITGMSGNVPVMMKQLFDTMTNATGVDMREIMKANTLAASTDRNIRLDAELGLTDNIQE